MGLACTRSSDGDTKHVYSTSRGSLLQNSHFEDQEHDCTRSGSQISGTVRMAGTRVVMALNLPMLQPEMWQQ
jgi:hypothetical protein